MHEAHSQVALSASIICSVFPFGLCFATDDAADAPKLAQVFLPPGPVCLSQHDEAMADAHGGFPFVSDDVEKGGRATPFLR